LPQLENRAARRRQPDWIFKPLQQQVENLEAALPVHCLRVLQIRVDDFKAARERHTRCGILFLLVRMTLAASFGRGARRWPNGVRCPRCGNSAVYHLSREWYWQCEKCAPDGYRFSHIAGTLFENTNKPLRDWFRVIHLMLKKDMSTHEIHWLMGFGSYKTAWYMCHRVRAALADGSLQKLAGVVVVDETFIVGEAKRSQARDVARELLKRADAIVQHAQRLDEAETIKIEASRAIADEWTRMRELARELRLYLPSRQDFFSSKDAVLQRDAIAKELGERVP
jgi:Transposase zinc-ribbon domain